MTRQKNGANASAKAPSRMIGSPQLPRHVFEQLRSAATGKNPEAAVEAVIDACEGKPYLCEAMIRGAILLGVAGAS